MVSYFTPPGGKRRMVVGSSEHIKWRQKKQTRREQTQAYRAKRAQHKEVFKATAELDKIKTEAYNQQQAELKAKQQELLKQRQAEDIAAGKYQVYNKGEAIPESLSAREKVEKGIGGYVKSTVKGFVKNIANVYKDYMPVRKTDEGYKMQIPGVPKEQIKGIATDSDIRRYAAVAGTLASAWGLIRNGAASGVAKKTIYTEVGGVRFPVNEVSVKLTEAAVKKSTSGIKNINVIRLVEWAAIAAIGAKSLNTWYTGDDIVDKIRYTYQQAMALGDTEKAAEIRQDLEQAIKTKESWRSWTPIGTMETFDQQVKGLKTQLDLIDQQYSNPAVAEAGRNNFDWQAYLQELEETKKEIADYTSEQIRIGQELGIQQNREFWEEWRARMLEYQQARLEMEQAYWAKVKEEQEKEAPSQLNFGGVVGRQ